MDYFGRKGGEDRGNQRGVEVVYSRCDRSGALRKKHIDHQDCLTEKKFPGLNLINLEPY